MKREKAFRRTHRIEPSRIDRLVKLLDRYGFLVDDGASGIMWGGWTRYYNFRRALPVRDWTGKVEPRIYSPGAIGVQIEWIFRGGDERASWSIWRNTEMK